MRDTSADFGSGSCFEEFMAAESVVNKGFAGYKRVGFCKALLLVTK